MGDRVRVWWAGEGAHFDGTISGASADGAAFDVTYDDGDHEVGVDPALFSGNKVISVLDSDDDEDEDDEE